MEERMKSWSTFFKVVGWICVVVGLIAIVFTVGASLILVVVGMGVLFTSAVLEWMDGVLEHLSEIRKTQQTISESLWIMRQKNDQAGEHRAVPDAAAAEHRPAPVSGSDAVNAFINDKN